MTIRVAIVLVLAAACSQQDRAVASTDSLPRVAAVSTCAGGEGLLDGRRMGSIRLGMPVDSAIALCPRAHDTIEYDEGQPGRVLVAAIDGDTVRIRITANTVRSILVETPRFQTADSLKVGMTVARLLDLPELTGGAGEGTFYAWSNHASVCGMSFRLDNRTADAHRRARRVTRSSLAPYASTGRVTHILVRGC